VDYINDIKSCISQRYLKNFCECEKFKNHSFLRNVEFDFLFLEFSGGSYGGGGGSDLQMQEMPDTIFVQGLGEDITDGALAAHFGSIGVIKVLLVTC